MRSFNRQTNDTMSANGHGRLETPLMMGFRSGMSACSVIGRKLGSMYNVPADCPERMSTLIKAIDRTVRGTR